MQSSPLKILHIEDDGLYASLVQHMLTENDGTSAYEIIHVPSLKGGLSQLKNRQFEAVLLDLSLEDVSGMDNVRAIRFEQPALPIIVVTGYDDGTVAMKARDAGAQNVIIKGHTSESLLRRTIAASLSRKSQ